MSLEREKIRNVSLISFGDMGVNEFKSEFDTIKNNTGHLFYNTTMLEMCINMMTNEQRAEIMDKFKQMFE
jgi:hypothetical protein